MLGGITLAMALAAACGNKQVDPPSATGSAAGSGSAAAGAGSAVGSGSAAPSVSTACMPLRHKLAELVVDDAAATVCSVPDPEYADKTNPQRLFDDEIKPPQPQCMVADLVNGSWREAKPPPATSRPVAYEVKQDGKGVRVCKGASCTKLAAPPAKHAGKYLVAVSDDGRRAVVIADALKGAWWFDAATGNKLGELSLASAGAPLENGTALFLGERVYIAGTIYDWAGSPSGKVDLGQLTAAELVSLGSDLYAFVKSGMIEVVNARTATTREVKLHSTPQYIRASHGKLVTVSTELLAVIEPASGTIEKQLRVPICTVAAEARASQPSLVLFGEHALGKLGSRLINFGLGGEPGQPAPAEEIDDHADDAGIIAGVGETAYAITRVNNMCRNTYGDPRDWGKVAGDGPDVLLGRLTLEAADANDTFWATAGSGLYKLTRQGHRAVRVAEFPPLHYVLHSEPTRVLVVDLVGEPERGSNAVKPENIERRLAAVDKATGEATELLRGKNLRFERVMGNEVWIVRDGAELSSIAEAATEPTPRGSLPEAATSIEIAGDTVYFTPTAGDRVLATPIAGGASTVVADGLADAKILGASADRLFISAADPGAQARVDRQRAALPENGPPAPFPHEAPRRILSIAKTGGTPKVLAGDLETIHGAVSDADHIYVEVVTCYDDPDNGCGGLEKDPAIWVVDKRANRARRMSGVGSCKESFAVAGRGVWLSNGVRLDQRTAPPVFLGRGFPNAAVGAGSDLFLAMDHRVVRASSSGYEVIADVSADALAIGGSYLYFHDAAAARIGRIATRTGKVETVVANLPSVAEMTADARGIYWWGGGSQPIEAASAPGARRTVLAHAGNPSGLAANGGRLAVLAGAHLTVVAADGASRTIALGTDGAGVACDDNFVYWTEDGEIAVLQRDKWSGGDLHVVSRVTSR